MIRAGARTSQSGEGQNGESPHDGGLSDAGGLGAAESHATSLSSGLKAVRVVSEFHSVFRYAKYDIGRVPVNGLLGFGLVNPRQIMRGR
jgi:hypothetical protein